jgi:hypothetical protein
LKALNSSAVQSSILLSGLAAFVLFFGAYVFIAPWGGDIHVYLAAIHSLYRDMWHPHDVSLDVKSGYSAFFSPYIVLVALAGKILGVTPYRALQLAGIFNVALYAWSITLFCRTFSAVPKSPWPPLLLLGVSLFLRFNIYSWSSETSYITLSIIQAYPSFLGWSLALFSFAITERIVQRRSAGALIGLALLIAFFARTHAITASWAIGTIGLRALYLLFAAAAQLYGEGKFSSAALRPALLTSLSIDAALALGIGVSLLWPYYSPLVFLQFAGIAENSPFGSNPFAIMPVTYLLAAAALLISPHRRIYQFWIVAFVATLGAWAAFRLIGLQYGDRYAFFMAFFAQFIVADCAAVALTRFLSPTEEPRIGPRRAISALYLALFTTACAFTPALHNPQRSRILSLHAWRNGASAENAYYRTWAPLRAVIRPGEVVMVIPSYQVVFDIPAVTGASIVALPIMVGVPDGSERQRSVERFFSPGQSQDIRLQELRRWHTTKVMLIPPVLDRSAEMEALLGPPVWRDETRIIFAVEPKRFRIGLVDE